MTGSGQHHGNEPRHGSCGEQRCGDCSSLCGGGYVLDKKFTSILIFITKYNKKHFHTDRIPL